MSSGFFDTEKANEKKKPGVTEGHARPLDNPIIGENGRESVYNLAEFHFPVEPKPPEPLSVTLSCSTISTAPVV